MRKDRAIRISQLIEKMQYFENVIEMLTSGYADEWELRNTHTGVVVEINQPTHDAVSNYSKKQLSAIVEQLDKI